MRQYKFSPSIIKDFVNYINETGYEKDGENIPFVTEQNLLDRINKVPSPMGEAAKKGMDFESVLLGGVSSYGYNFLDKQELMERMRAYLPKYYYKQVWVECKLPELNTVVGGYTDVVGAGTVTDIKTTSNYDFPGYINDAQLLYLKALENSGVSEMQYVITNFSEIFIEKYHLSNLRFDTIYENIERLQLFVDANIYRITNLAIIGQEEKMPWLTEAKLNMYMSKIGVGDTEYVKNDMIKYRMKTLYRQKLIDSLFQNN